MPAVSIWPLANSFSAFMPSAPSVPLIPPSSLRGASGEAGSGSAGKQSLIMNEQLRNPFEEEPATPRNPDTAGMVGSILGEKAGEAFRKLEKGRKKAVSEQPPDLSDKDKAALRAAQAELERNKERFPIWRTIQIGRFKTAKKIKQALDAGGFHVDSPAEGVLKKIPFLGVPSEIELVRIEFSDLDFDSGATLRKIYDKAAELGLDPCPAEVGPELRLQYLDQPMGEWLGIAMNPISDSKRLLSVFTLGHGIGLVLQTGFGAPDVPLRSISLIFVRRK